MMNNPKATTSTAPGPSPIHLIADNVVVAITNPSIDPVMIVVVAIVVVMIINYPQSKTKDESTRKEAPIIFSFAVFDSLAFPACVVGYARGWMKFN